MKNLNIFLPMTLKASLYQWYRRRRHDYRVASNAYLALKARRQHRYPAKNMRIIGVTGTDGKTTTTIMLANILRKAGRKVGYISTVEAKIGDEVLDVGLHVSTPGPVKNYALLAKMRDEAVEDVVIEATSHGLDQRRLFGIQFDVAVVTNIAPEHLDYHLTLENYMKAKSLIFAQSKTAVLNADDPQVMTMKTRNLPKRTYGLSNQADVKIEQIESKKGGTTFSLLFTQSMKKLSISLALPGVFNVANAAASAAAADLLNVPATAIQEGLSSTTVEGRWQILQDKPFTVIVDFAHTPQSFDLVLPLAREQTDKSGRIIHVFGSAAMRDESKRPEMGRLSGELADISIITMEDPRKEPIDRIQHMLISGLQKSGKKEKQGWLRVDDRRQAIRRALKMAKNGDVVIITGKGHEQSMSIGGQELPWSDIEVTNVLLKERAS